MTEDKTNQYIKLSLASIIATVIFASITHTFEFGFNALVVGAVMIAILSGLIIGYQRNKNKVLFWFYAVLNAWIIIGFGLINGFWNHTFKIGLTFLHNNSLPPAMASMFADPKIGSLLFEGAGIMTFIASLVATYYIFQMAPKRKNNLEEM